MKWIKALDFNEFTLKDCILTVGNFDGLHLGHQELIDSLMVRSKSKNVPSLVISFNPHPMNILHPEIDLKRLFSFEDLSLQLAKKNVEYLLEVPFSTQFSNMSANEFLHEFLIKKFNPRELVLGYDFSFGKDRLGNIKFLEGELSRKKVDLVICKPKLESDRPISSTRIRQEIQAGNVTAAAELLGRPYYYKSVVIKGEQNGRKIGFPTANLDVSAGILPESGVFATKTITEGKSYNSVTNIGTRPTLVNSKLKLLETHLIDTKLNLYGKTIKVEFIKHIRGEIKFKSIDELKNQISKDIQLIRELN